MKKMWIPALIFALLAGVAVFFALNNVKSTPASVQNMVQVVVAAKDIGDRTAITADMLTLKQLPAEAVLPNTVRSTEQVVGKVTNASIETGEQLLLSRVVQTQDAGAATGLTAAIPKGQRAFTFSVDDNSGVAGFIRPGDYVDINLFMTVAVPPQTAQPTTMLLMQNVQVLAVAQNLSASQKTSYSNITVALTPQQVLKLSYATNSGKLQLTLRSTGDKDAVSTEPQNAGNFNK